MIDRTLLNQVNQSVLQDRINNLRTQKETIRDRMRNPGLYNTQVAPTPITSLSQVYRPSQALLEKAGMSSGDRAESSGYSTGMGVGLSGPVAGILGDLVGMATSMRGNPFGAVMGTAVSGALSGKTDAQQAKAMKDAIARSALNAVVSHINPMAGLTLGLAGLFGFNPVQGFTEMLGLSDVIPGFEGGFFGSPGIGQGISGNIGMGMDTPAGFSSSDLGTGITGSIAGMSGLGNDPAGTGGGVSGSDPGPSGTGNSGNAGEA